MRADRQKVLKRRLETRPLRRKVFRQKTGRAAVRAVEGLAVLRPDVVHRAGVGDLDRGNSSD